VSEALLDEVKTIMGGNIKDDDEFIGDLRYVSADGEIDIPIKDAATGLKTFAYLYRLIENGHITPETILIIDEPEEHLHPKWAVEVARHPVGRADVVLRLSTSTEDVDAGVLEVA